MQVIEKLAILFDGIRSHVNMDVVFGVLFWRNGIQEMFHKEMMD